MFVVKSRKVSGVEPFEFLEGVTDEVLTVGEAAVLNGGKLTKCGATVKPGYIVMGKKNGQGKFPAIKVLPTTLFEVEVTADQSALSVGAAVTLHSDGAKVTATTANGVFTLVSKGSAAGKTCVGYFA